MLIRYVALASYIALLALAAHAWREGDDIEMRLPSMEMMTESRAGVDKITSLETTKRLLGLSLDAHVSLQDAMRTQIHTQRRFLIEAIVLGLPALAYVIRATQRTPREAKSAPPAAAPDRR